MNQSLRTIAVTGGFGYGNFGDDALMLAVYEIATKTFGSQCINFFCQDAGYMPQILPGVKVVSPGRVKGPIVDILLYGGGTQFYSFPLTKGRTIPSFSSIVRNLRKPARILPKVRRRIRQSLPHAEMAHKLAAIGIGLGPFVDKSSRFRECNRLFRRMEYVAVRDTYSYRLCQEWGCRNLSLRSDLCYLPGLWQTGEFNCCRDASGSLERIGVIIRDWEHTYEGDSYAVPLFQVVDELRSAGKEVEFISFQMRSDSKWAKRLKDRDEEFKGWDPDEWTISEFLDLLSSYDAFITARYHGAVFASILGKPVVCIEVEQKLRLVSQLLGDGACLWTYPFSTSECLRHISDLEGDYLRSAESLAHVVQEQGTLAERMVDEFRQFVSTNYSKDM